SRSDSWVSVECHRWRGSRGWSGAVDVHRQYSRADPSPINQGHPVGLFDQGNPVGLFDQARIGGKMASQAYNQGLLELVNGTIAFASTDCYAILVDSNYTFSAAHTTYANVS